MDTNNFFNVDYEKKILGAYLADNQALYISTLTPECFYNSHNKIIFTEMTKVMDDIGAVNPVDIYEKLSPNVLLSDLMELESHGITERHYIKTYEETLIKLYKARSLRNVLLESMNELEKGNEADSIIAKVQSYECETKEVKQEVKPIGECLMAAIETLEKKFNNEVESINSGWKELDYLTGGFAKKKMFLIGARPGMGKTVFSINLARAIANTYKTLIFSIEMSEEQLANRILAAESGVNGMVINNGKGLNNNDIDKIIMAANAAVNDNLFIDDTPGISIDEIKNKIKVAKKKYGLDVVIIDHFLKIKECSDKDDLRGATTKVAREISEMAKALDINIILLTQLNRGVEMRADKRPTLADLKETSALEEEASAVIFLYRDEYYNKESEDKNILEVNIAKNRDGQMGTIKMFCDLRTQKIAPLFRR